MSLRETRDRRGFESNQRKLKQSILDAKKAAHILSVEEENSESSVNVTKRRKLKEEKDVLRRKRKYGKGAERLLRAQESRYAKPNLRSNRKLKVPIGGYTDNEIKAYYKLYREPAGGWRMNIRRTTDGIHINMLGPVNMDPEKEINEILRLKSMRSFTKNSFDFIQPPIIRGDSKIFKVRVKAEKIYK